jgi:hypothetical protein
MQRYVLVSGVFLTLLACVQLIRLVLRWSVIVAGVVIPLWASAVAALIAGCLAIWAFRVKGQGSSSTAV